MLGKVLELLERLVRTGVVQVKIHQPPAVGKLVWRQGFSLFVEANRPRDPVHLEEIKIAQSRIVRGLSRSRLDPLLPSLHLVPQRVRILRQWGCTDVVAVDRAFHAGNSEQPELGQERIVPVLYEEINAVLIAMEIRPRLRLVHVPEAVAAATQHDGKIRLARLGHQQTEIARKDQAVRFGGAEEFDDSLLLSL